MSDKGSAGVGGWGKRLLMRLVGEDRYYTMRAARDFRRAVAAGKEILFVHQMGKVGSTAVVDSLKAQGIEQTMTIYQTHFMTEAGGRFVEAREAAGYGGWERLPARTKSFLLLSRYVGEQLRQGYLEQHPSRVITLVRDPVATNLSGYFHNAHWWPADLRAQAQRREGDYLARLKDHFLETYPHDVPLTWFDMELKPLFGVDVLAGPFPQEQGYRVYHGKHADVLLLKLETLAHSAPLAFGQFLGLNQFRLVKANRAADKWYATLYREFIAAVALPTAYLDRLYEAAVTRHFYSAAEIEALRDKWQTAVAANA